MNNKYVQKGAPIKMKRGAAGNRYLNRGTRKIGRIPPERRSSDRGVAEQRVGAAEGEKRRSEGEKEKTLK